MSTSETKTSEVAGDDYSLSRMPDSERYSWHTVAVQRFGTLSALAQFLLGATLGMHMTFWGAFTAITLGAVILEIVCIFTGIMGMREGLTTSMLARWSGFGEYGSALIGLIIAISLVGWFGIQNEVFADGLHTVIGGPPSWIWALLGGLVITLIVLRGFKSMALVAWVTVPAFILLTIYSIGVELSKHSLSELIAAEPAGDTMSVAAGATLVAGGFIAGAVVTPDVTRFNRSVADVVKQTLVSVTLGEYLIGLCGVLLALALRSSDVVQIVTTTGGLVGSIILILAIVKINDWNLYWSSNGATSLINTVTGRSVSRVHVTLILGVIGSVLSAVGILDVFVPFLTTLGVVLPPVGAIMAVDYFVLKRSRAALDASRELGEVPQHSEKWNPIAMVVWIAASLVGYYLDWGIPVLNSLLTAAVGYYLLMRVAGRFTTAVVHEKDTAQEAAQ